MARGEASGEPGRYFRQRIKVQIIKKAASRAARQRLTSESTTCAKLKTMTAASANRKKTPKDRRKTDLVFVRR
jgi:hypothetical protein